MTDVKLALRGLRGESLADIARRVGQIGGVSVDEDASDEAILEALFYLSLNVGGIVGSTAPLVYASTAAGLAAVAEGGTFWAVSGAGIALYRDVAGTAALIMTLAQTALFLPNQTNFPGSLALGSGLRNLTHAAGEQGWENLTFGEGAGDDLTSGYANILIGARTGGSMTGIDTLTTYGATQGNSGNVFVGRNIAAAANGALDNTGVGTNVFLNLSTGMDNVGFGIDALTHVGGGSENVAIGHAALKNLAGSGIYSTGDGHRMTALGDMAARFLNDGTTPKTGGKFSTYLGTRTGSLDNTAVNENVIGSGAAGFGTNSVSLGNPDVEQQRHQGLVLCGMGAQDIPPLAPVHAYNDATEGVGQDGLRASRAGASQIYTYLELLNGTTVAVLGCVGNGDKGSFWVRLADDDDDTEIFPLKFDETGQVYLEEVVTSAGVPNVRIDPSTGKLTESTGAVTTYTPTITAGTGSFGSAPTVQNATWRYTSPGRASQQLDFTIPAAGTATDSLIIDLPVNAARNANAVTYDANGVAYSALIRDVGSGVYKLIILTFAGATAIATGRVFSVSIEWDTV